MGTNEGTALGFEAAAAIVTHSCGDIPGKVVVVTRSRSPTQFIRAVIAEAAAEMDLARALDPLSPICAGRREITKVRWRTFAMRKRLSLALEPLLARLEEADNGVYIEVELVSLSSQPGMLDRGRLLNGFVQKFPHEFTEGIIEGLQQAFPNRR